METKLDGDQTRWRPNSMETKLDGDQTRWRPNSMETKLDGDQTRWRPNSMETKLGHVLYVRNKLIMLGDTNWLDAPTHVLPTHILDNNFPLGGLFVLYIQIVCTVHTNCIHLFNHSLVISSLLTDGAMTKGEWGGARFVHRGPGGQGLAPCYL